MRAMLSEEQWQERHIHRTMAIIEEDGVLEIYRRGARRIDRNPQTRWLEWPDDVTLPSDPDEPPTLVAVGTKLVLAAGGK